MNKKHDFIMHQKKDKHLFFEKLFEHCYINPFTGNFHCKICKAAVHIDWYRNLAFCKNHIISTSGIIELEEIYKICIKNNEKEEENEIDT